ncbi:T9SS sorting signal type C domain-containing protein [Flavobacterium reichenbachii]|uniref:Calcium-binding protein n=1 Tax=Flavobacterium reichenbachii TaxID=362418 RepID=A0A085ZCB8_9FLAO|nr:T9SS sorting signal type C domain-containing protein [Flavobacterium reichenbachii]KFF02082.1 calcium-binding protein [Flavobacterium reichenbachii]OXB14252.1 calcium-binding protein [Flavobacterium reichenbachii]
MIKNLLCSLILIILPFKIEIFAQQGKVDKTFNTLDDGLSGDGFNNTVRTVLLQSDDNLIVGGDYLSLNGIACPYFARLKPDGSLDENFRKGIGFNNKVYASAVQPDGKIIAAGSFTSYNNINAGRLIRLNNDGSYDDSFNTSIGAATGIIYDISLQPDGKMIIVGSFTKFNNSTVNRIARIFPDGSLDTSFASQTGIGSSLNITNAKVLSDGKILIAGNFTTFNGTSSYRIARLKTNGTIDSSFNIGTGFNDDVNDIEIQPDGKIIIGGNFTTFNGDAVNRIVRLNEDGTRDYDFLSGTGLNSGAVEVIKIDDLGNIMIGGSFTGNYNGVNVNRVFLLNADGTIKTDFDLGSGPGSASVLALAVDSERSWFIGGSFSVFDGLNQGRLAKVNSDGEHDASYLAAGIGFNNSVLNILPLEDKKIIVVGNFNKFNGASVSKIARLQEDGSIDDTFNAGKSGASGLIKAAVLQADGKMILGGNFTNYNGTASNRIIRISADGLQDNTFNIGSGFNGQVYTLTAQTDGKIIATGSFTSYSGVAAGKIVRLMPDGSRDLSFNVGSGFNDIVEAVVIQPDAKILAAGRFTSFNGNSYSRLIRLNSDGSVDSSFNTGLGFEKNVYSLALQSDQKIILGGAFLTYNGVSQKRIVRLNPNGSLDISFDSGIGFSNGDVRSILVQSDDKILVGGTFSGTYKNTPSLRLIRLLKTGSYDSSFEAQLNNKLFVMAVTSDFKLVIGGNFNSISGISKHRIARIRLCFDSTTWNGLSWSKGFPSGGKEIAFKGDYPNLTAADVCSCTIDEGKVVTLLSDNTLGLEFSYSGLGTLVLENSASLYQSDDDMINTGIVHLKRNTTPVSRYDLTSWASPVENQSLVDFSPYTLSDKYFSYDDTNKKWIVEQPSNLMSLGRGYSIRAPQYFSITEREVFEAAFKGVPNNGRVMINFNASDSYSLIGNPYPSAVDANAFLKKNTSKTKGALYFWTHNTPVANFKYSNDDYAVYNRVGGVGVSALSTGVNERIPNGTIASGQAFFIESTDAGTVEFNNSMRIHGRNTEFYKSSNKKQTLETDQERHRIWLDLKTKDGFFKQILLGYIDGATNSYDLEYDARSINGNQAGDFYSVVENKKLTIQGRALPFDNTDSIVLGFKTAIEGTFNISIDQQDEFFDGQNIYLEDKDLNTVYNLKECPYEFFSEIGTFNKRFVLKFIDEALGIQNYDSIKTNLLISVKNRIINIDSKNNTIDDVVIFDILGKQIYKKKSISNTNFSIQNLGIQNQVLILKVVLESGFVQSKKIIYY